MDEYFNPLMRILKPQSNGQLYSNTAIGTLAVVNGLLHLIQWGGDSYVLYNIWWGQGMWYTHFIAPIWLNHSMWPFLSNVYSTDVTRKFTLGRLKPLPFPSLPLPFRSFPLSFPSRQFSLPSPSLRLLLPLLRSRAPQIQLGGLGERCKLPQRGLEQSPSRNRIWCILVLKWQQF